MTNKHLTRTPSDLIKKKLEILLSSVNNFYNNSSMVVEEDLVGLYNSAISTFFESMDGSITSIISKFIPGLPADPTKYNIFTNTIGMDIEALFAEIGVLDKLIASSYNSIIANREQVLQISKRTANKLGDYLLYADPSLGAGFFFGDSFNSAERLDIGSSLVDTEECFHGQDEGVILLPLDGSPQRPEIKSIIINDRSNGSPGNNIESDIFGKDDISVIGDGEPDTWFEYDKVTAYESDTPLILDITITLKKLSIINHIHINPINFGSSTPIKITTIETSKDGKEYTSIKDELPIKDFVPEDEDNIFELSAATNKYAGEGFYSFLPRKAQYVHLVFEQYTPYAVVGSDNIQRLRYAIGLRDINIYGRKFKTEGSIVSTSFTSEKEIKKVSLWASENPIERSTLADITHAISHNDGATWLPIQPTRRSENNIEEVINFNTIATNAIQTSSPVQSLRHKVYMKRDTAAFNENITIKEERIPKTELVSVPASSTPQINLEEQPISDTVKITLPFWGSYSCPRARAGTAVAGESFQMELDHVDFNVDVPAIDTLRFALPYKGFSNLKDHIRVFINGEQIEYCLKDESYLDFPSDTSYTTIDENSKVYFLNKEGTELQFGVLDSDRITRRGFLPPGGSRISVVLDGDNPSLELTDQGYILNLSASSDGFKQNMNLVYFENIDSNEAIDFQMDLPLGKTKAKTTSSLGSSFASIGTVTQTNKNIISSSQKVGTGLSSSQRAGRGQTSSKTTKNNSSSVQNSVKPVELIEQNSRIQKTALAAKAATEARRAQIQNAENFAIAEKNAKEYELAHQYELVTDGDGGILPPIFNEDTAIIEEYSSAGALLPASWTRKDFIDGDIELKDLNPSTGQWVVNERYFSFDSYTGTVHLGGETSSEYKTIFKCKRLKASVVPDYNWEFYRDFNSGKIYTDRLLLSNSAVKTIGKTISVSASQKSVSLVPTNVKQHDWFNQRVVKGTVKLDPSLFSEGSKPIEVPFKDGYSELNNTIEVLNEKITFGTAVDNLYTFTLKNIYGSKSLVSSPGFAAVRNSQTVLEPINIFEQYVTTTPENNGEWTYNNDGEVQVYYSSTILFEHIVSYKYVNGDPGVNFSGLYSIDYNNGIVHFANPTVLSGNIKFSVSIYSAFYNIAEVIPDSEIEEINEENKKITLSSYLGLKFLKLDTAQKARPQFMKVTYEYYKKSTESIKDLEPYFSPICKDIAFRSITADLLEEL